LDALRAAQKYEKPQEEEQEEELGEKVECPVLELDTTKESDEVQVRPRFF